LETLFSIDLTNRGGEYLAPTVLASFPASTVFSQAAGSSAHTGSISTSGGGNLWWLAPLGVGGGLYEGTR
jgi:hypothetical protein